MNEEGKKREKKGIEKTLDHRTGVPIYESVVA